MSADNYYVIRRHPHGGYAAVMGFASTAEEPKARPDHQSFSTLGAALDFANSEYSEYGTSIHSECNAITIGRDRLEATMRLLINEGHMTPLARLQIRKLFKEDNVH